MKTPRITNAVGYIDDELVTLALDSKKKARHTYWAALGAVAACFAVLVIAGGAILPSLFGASSPADEASGKYKNHTVEVENIAIVWSWEYLTVYEKYTELKLDGIEYHSRGRAVSDQLIGELIGRHSVSGYDEIKDEKHTDEFEVYTLKYADRGLFVAVRLDGTCYVFKNREYDPPSTLGELWASVDLPDAIELKSFSENVDTRSAKYFSLRDDDYIWEVLAECKNAEFVEDDRWSAHDREYLSFTVTSETLGVYKVAMYITDDGYLWTNAFGYQYLFNIGDDAAKKIIKHANENCDEAEYEPYRNAIVGEITRITDEYILVDDSVLCNDRADGITYKVMLNDLRINRYIDRGVVQLGDTVKVTYDGEVDTQSSNTIDSAIAITKARIVFDNEDNTSHSEDRQTVTSTKKWDIPD